MFDYPNYIDYHWLERGELAVSIKNEECRFDYVMLRGISSEFGPRIEFNVDRKNKRGKLLEPEYEEHVKEAFRALAEEKLRGEGVEIKEGERGLHIIDLNGPPAIFKNGFVLSVQYGNLSQYRIAPYGHNPKNSPPVIQFLQHGEKVSMEEFFRRFPSEKLA